MFRGGLADCKRCPSTPVLRHVLCVSGVGRSNPPESWDDSTQTVKGGLFQPCKGHLVRPGKRAVAFPLDGSSLWFWRGEQGPCVVHACCCQVPHVLPPPGTRGRTQGASWARPAAGGHVSLTSLNLWATEHRSPGDAANQQCPRGDRSVCSLCRWAWVSHVEAAGQLRRRRRFIRGHR